MKTTAYAIKAGLDIVPEWISTDKGYLKQCGKSVFKHVKHKIVPVEIKEVKK